MSDLSRALGMPLDEWQDQVLEAAMGERSNGKWASKFVGLSVSRQNGKSQIIVARALAGILLFGEKTIIISAHDADTAREVWKRMTDVIDDNPSLLARVSSRLDAINRETISFGTGKDRQTIKLKARSKTGTRGFSADCLLLDEAQILGKSAWGSIVPTMSARPNPQLWLFGTPPTEGDDAHAFSNTRDKAIEGRVRHCWVEWAAAPGDDFDDPKVWAKANPSYGVRISREACADDRAAMDDDQFARERLGMWELRRGTSVIPAGSWADAADPDSEPVDNLTLGVECAPDLKWASVMLAGQRVDGRWSISVEEDQHTQGPGVAWLEDHLRTLTANNPLLRGVVVDVGGPIKALVEEHSPGKWRFKESRIPVQPLRVAELGAASTDLLAGIVSGQVTHLPNTALTAAAGAAGKRALGDSGLWVFSRRGASSDITQIQAAVYALAGAKMPRIRRPAGTRERTPGRVAGGRTGGRRHASAVGR